MACRSSPVYSRNVQSSVYEFFSKVGEARNCVEISEKKLGWPNIEELLWSKTTSSKVEPSLLICSSDECLPAYDCLSYICAKKGVKYQPVMLPDIRATAGDSMQSFYVEFRKLFSSIAWWYSQGCSPILISPLCTILNAVPNMQQLPCLEIKIGDKISFSELEKKLVSHGYEMVDVVETEGEISFKKDVVDIFVPNLDDPVRIRFSSCKVDRIYNFDARSQVKCVKDLPSIIVFPAMFVLDTNEANIAEYTHAMESESYCSFRAEIDRQFWQLRDLGGVSLLEHYPSVWTVDAMYEYRDLVLLGSMDPVGISLHILPPPKKYEDFEPDISNIEDLLKINEGKAIDVIGPNPVTAKGGRSSKAKYLKMPFCVNISSHDHMVLSTTKSSGYKGRRVIDLNVNSMGIGEYVVHDDYGVGLFDGIEQIRVCGGLKDFIRIKYLGDDRLFLPVENADYICRYFADGNTVTLDKLGKSRISRTRSKIKTDLLEIASDIVAVHAKRDVLDVNKIELSGKDREMRWAEFERARGFEITRDQKIAIKDILKDMSSGRAMDRFLSGDVGFGKTEVAMTAMFATSMSGLSSVLLVPTTLLSAQHHESLVNRFKDLNVEVLRYDGHSNKHQKCLVSEKIKGSRPIIIVGTHAVLGLDIQNLGLVVIDEEHKFGVKQKELMKHKFIGAHMLSMSATPIPRTLGFIYSSLRPMSTLRTPPSYKKESRTFVRYRTDSLIVEVVNRELRRGGQVFYILNNISEISTVRENLLSLMPNIRILVLHSKIQQRELENGMLDFMRKKYDLLLSTSIVESGLHLPNANTIIVDEAQNFGLADLHQLRGRVGRGHIQGLCYLLTSDKNLSEKANKRLLALEKNSYLGSGFALAYHDLEIRGAGNLLGQAQSGHIKQIGFEMYAKMLEETLRGMLAIHGEKNSDNKIDLRLSVSAFLSSEVVYSERLRLNLYKRLSMCKSENEVRQIEAEIKERFGELDKYSSRFMTISSIKVLGVKSGAKLISNSGRTIKILHYDGREVKMQSESAEDEEILDAITKYLGGLQIEKV